MIMWAGFYTLLEASHLVWGQKKVSYLEIPRKLWTEHLGNCHESYSLQFEWMYVDTYLWSKVIKYFTISHKVNIIFTTEKAIWIVNLIVVISLLYLQNYISVLNFIINSDLGLLTKLNLFNLLTFKIFSFGVSFHTVVSAHSVLRVLEATYWSPVQW
jgi:hypothetical protein